MSIEDALRGNEFDHWMGGDSGGPAAEPAAPPPVSRKGSTEVPAKKAGKAKGGNPQRKKLLLSAVGCAAALVVGVGAWSAFSPSSAPPAAPEVEAVMARAATIEIGTVVAPAIEPVADPVAVMLSVVDAVPLPAPVPEAPAAVLAAEPAPAPPVVAELPVVAAPPEVAVAPVAVTDSTAAPAKADDRLALRVEALEGDLHRTKQRLSVSRSEVAVLKKKLAAAPAAGHTLSAVLSDGAVVKDSSGREYVVKVGSEVRQ